MIFKNEFDSFQIANLDIFSLSYNNKKVKL